VTTGLKCAPLAGRNTTIRTARPSAVTTELTSSRSAASVVSRVTAIPDPHDRDQQAGAGELGGQPPA